MKNEGHKHSSDSFASSTANRVDKCIYILWESERMGEEQQRHMFRGYNKRSVGKSPLDRGRGQREIETEFFLSDRHQLLLQLFRPVLRKRGFNSASFLTSWMTIDIQRKKVSLLFWKEQIFFFFFFFRHLELAEMRRKVGNMIVTWHWLLPNPVGRGTKKHTHSPTLSLSHSLSQPTPSLFLLEKQFMLLALGWLSERNWWSICNF